MMVGFGFLFEENFIGFSSRQGPLLVACLKDGEFICLLCLLSRGEKVGCKSRDEVLDHIFDHHPELKSFIDESCSRVNVFVS